MFFKRQIASLGPQCGQWQQQIKNMCSQKYLQSAFHFKVIYFFFFPEDFVLKTEMVNLSFKINLGSDIFNIKKNCNQARSLCYKLKPNVSLNSQSINLLLNAISEVVVPIWASILPLFWQLPSIRNRYSWPLSLLLCPLASFLVFNDIPKSLYKIDQMRPAIPQAFLNWSHSI